MPFEKKVMSCYLSDYLQQLYAYFCDVLYKLYRISWNVNSVVGLIIRTSIVRKGFRVN
jgi:hypothetical protein